MEKYRRLPSGLLTKYLSSILVLIFISFPLGQLLRINITQLIHLQVIDLLAALSLPATIHIILTNPKIIFTRWLKSLLIFISLLHLSLVLNISYIPLSEIAISYHYILRLIFYISLSISVFYLIEIQPKAKQFIIKGLIYSTLALAIFGLIQYLFYPDIRSLSIYGWDPHYFRLVSTLLDPGFTGIILVLGLSLSFFVIPFSPAQIIITTTLYISLSLTYSRASYIAFLGLIIYAAKIRHSFKFFVFWITIFITTLFLLPRLSSIGTQLEREDTIFARIKDWKNSFTIFKDHPLFGVGFNNFRLAKIKYNFLAPEEINSHANSGADSSILFTFATTGIFGGIFLLWTIYSLISHGSNHHLHIINSLILIILVHSLFLNSLYYPWILLFLALSLPTLAHS